MGTDNNRTKLPGFGLPLTDWGLDEEKSKYLSAVQGWYYEPSTIRERCMLAFMNDITDKPNWKTKLLNEEIKAKWKKEAMELDWREVGIKYGDMSEKMFEYCIKELCDKAALEEKWGFVPIFDTTSAIIKADSIIAPDVKAALKQAVAGLENVPDAQKDWHPGSNDLVIDLVHPSLFPLIYGRSRVLPNFVVSVDDSIRSIGKGEVLPVQDPIKTDMGAGWKHSDVSLWSNHFQWLPCNVSFPDGANAKIESYINNLHPADHKDLYGVIEKIITKAVPMWNIAYQFYVFGDHPKPGPRIECRAVEYDWPDGIPEERLLDSGEESDSDERYERDEEYEQEHRTLIRPEPPEYEGHAYKEDILTDFFAFPKDREKKLQVIVKMANIHLTPEKPEYEGGSWHIEGQLNEHIVATALYYYDNHNITDSHLLFRTGLSDQCLDNLRYNQGDDKGIKRIFGFKNFSRPFQDIGSVLTREDRLLVFPNGFQHKVSDFKLQDPTQSGHRKILALFLVDPNIPILSTANVPPQQRDWWLREMKEVGGQLGDLPVEIYDMVIDGVDEFPLEMEEAKRLRKELMAERGRMDMVADDYVAQNSFHFCEH